MSEDFTEHRVTFTERKACKMSGVAKASELLEEMCAAWPRRISFKDAVRRATDAVNKAGRAGGYLLQPIKHSRIEDLWRKEARRIDAEEMDAIRAAHGALLRKSQDEHKAILERIARIEAALRLSSEDAYRELVAGPGVGASRVDRPMDQGA